MQALADCGDADESGARMSGAVPSSRGPICANVSTHAVMVRVEL